MKNSIKLLLLLIPFTVSAQGYPGMGNLELGAGMNQQDMNKMMENVKKMTLCMSKINPAELKRVEMIARKQDAEVQRLCAAGKRSQAEKKGIAIGSRMLKDPTIKKINECQKFMVGKIPTAPGMKDDGIHICDQMVDAGQY